MADNKGKSITSIHLSDILKPDEIRRAIAIYHKSKSETTLTGFKSRLITDVLTREKMAEIDPDGTKFNLEYLCYAIFYNLKTQSRRS